MSVIHLNIRREDADQLLYNSGRDGSYLVRESESTPGAFIMCVLYRQKVHQYKILKDEKDRLYMQAVDGVQKRRFADLETLIDDYVQRGEQNGLSTQLTVPLISGGYSPEKELNESTVSASEPSFSYDGPVHRYFLQRFTTIDLSHLDGAFIEQLRVYTERGALHDADRVKSDEEQLDSLRNLVAGAAQHVNKELDNFFAKLDAMRLLFGPIQTSTLVELEAGSEDYKEVLNVSKIVDKLERCKTAIKNLERKAKILRHGVEKWTMANRVNLEVDITNGKLFAIRRGKDAVLSDDNVFTHDKITQLVKSTSYNNRLDIMIEGRKKETYVFSDARQRETFCQLVTELKHQHATLTELEQLSLFIGTWNMGEEPLPRTFLSWLRSQGLGRTRARSLLTVPHDVYVIGVQESVAGREDWATRLRAELTALSNDEWDVVVYASLWSIKLIVLVKSIYMNMITHVQQSSVKTGIANIGGNKGAVGVSFYISGTSLCFINAHLTSGNEKNNRRINNYRDIVKGLQLGTKIGSGVDVTNKFHHVFFFGDLNFRNDGMHSEEIIANVKQKNYEDILKFDQLKISQKQCEAFIDFDEDPIMFPPTYRLSKGSHEEYEWQKQKTGYVRINAPSWCDRVLWKSYPDNHIHCTSYGCTSDIKISDHRPVFATFDIGIQEQFAAVRSQHQSLDISIVLEHVHARVRSSVRQNFKLEIHSVCMSEPVTSSCNGSFDASEPGYCCPRWVGDQLPKIRPILDDLEYLEYQHLLLVVKPAEGQESIGDCVVSLRRKVNQQSYEFARVLTHNGEYAGEIRGTLHIKQAVTVAKAKKIRRSYDLVYMDTELLDGDSKSAHAHNPLSLTRSLPASRLAPTPERLSYYENVSNDTSSSGSRESSLSRGMTLPGDVTDSSLEREALRRPREERAADAPSRREAVASELLENDAYEPCDGQQPVAPPRKANPKRKPMETVEDFLCALKLPQYTENFLSNGWDQLEFLGDLTEGDLQDIQVDNEEDRRTILHSINLFIPIAH